MGVPRLFRWLAERYPLALRDLLAGSGLAGLSLSSLNVPAIVSSSCSSSGEPSLADAAAPKHALGVDRLYLDFNGVVHHCAHGSGLHRTMEESGRPLVHDIFAYLERIVDVVRPQQLLFIAIDGVAPRAKMNQQRQRRYRSAGERAERIEELKRQRKARKEHSERSSQQQQQESTAAAAAAAGELGEPVVVLPSESVPAAEALLEGTSDDGDEEASLFDSNCITPGTEFMQMLSESLRFFVQKKIASDSAWGGLEVVLSGAEVPGEGEHKISEFIRSQKRRKDYNADITHCVYGMDADLMMLALASHEPNFLILREKVIFRQAGAADHRAVSFQQTEQFQVLSVGLLRHYLFNELVPMPIGGKQPVLTTETSGWFERKIDDFVFLCYLCGNDFLPALPFLDIGEDALQHIFEAYRACSPRWTSGFLTDPSNGSVNLDGFRDILRHLTANVEAVKFKALASKAGVSDDTAHLITELVERVSVPVATDAPAEIPATPDVPRAQLVATDSEADRQFASLQLKSLLRVPVSIDPSTLRRPSKQPATADQDQALSDDITSLLSEITVSKSPLAAAAAAAAASVPAGAAAESSGASASAVEVVPKISPALQPSSSMLRKDVLATVPVSVAQKFEFEFKKTYYVERLLRGNFSAGQGTKQAEKVDVGAGVLDACLNYIEGMVWTFNYYYHGHLSWRWFYQYHAAPFASDFLLMLLEKDDSKLRISDRLSKVFSAESAGKPFSPLCQLLAVLPPQSARLLPAAHASLMLEPESPIYRMFHPPAGAEKFEEIVDPGGRDYKNIALIPWIHEKKFLSAVRKAVAQQPLAAASAQRDQFGLAYVFMHESCSSGDKAKPRKMKSPFSEDNALAQFVATDAVICDFLRPNDQSDVVPERNIFESLVQPATLPPGGFPSFLPLHDHLHTVGVHRIRATVVAGPSRNDTLLFSVDLSARDVSSLKPRNEASFEEFARRFIGSKRPIYVDFPYQRRAFVTAIAGHDFTYTLSTKRAEVTAYPTASIAPYKFVSSSHANADDDDRRIQPEAGTSSRFDIVARALSADLLRRRGFDVGEVSALVHAVFDTLPPYEVLVPAQCCILDEKMVAALDSKCPDSQRTSLTDCCVKRGTPVVVLGPQHFGQVGIASAVAPAGETWVDVLLNHPSRGNEEFGAEIASRAAVADRYIRAADVARALQVPPLALARLTSTFTVICPPDESNTAGVAEAASKCEVGLGLKFSQRGVHVAGYARRVLVRNDDRSERAVWEYSERATALMREFKEMFAELVEALASDPHADEYNALEVFGADWKYQLARVSEWIRLSPIADAPLVPADCAALPQSAVRAIESAAVIYSEENPIKHLSVPSDNVSESAAAKKRRRKAKANLVSIRCQPGEYICAGSSRCACRGAVALVPSVSHRRPSLGDRVLCTKTSGMVPFGARGTVVSLYRDEVEVVLDHEVLSGSSLDGRLKTLRGARLETAALINLTRSRAPLGRGETAAAKPFAAAKLKNKQVASSNPFDMLGKDD